MLLKYTFGNCKSIIQWHNLNKLSAISISSWSSKIHGCVLSNLLLHLHRLIPLHLPLPPMLGHGASQSLPEERVQPIALGPAQPILPVPGASLRMNPRPFSNAFAGKKCCPHSRIASIPLAATTLCSWAGDAKTLLLPLPRNWAIRRTAPSKSASMSSYFRKSTFGSAKRGSQLSKWSK